MPIPMEKGQVLSLKVTSIIENKKQFPKSGELWHRHDIILEDKAGNTSVKEYITKSPEQKGFVIGVYQYVKCLFPNDKGDEITPVDDPFVTTPLAKAREIVGSTALPHGASESTTSHQPQQRPDVNGEARNCYSVKLTGESITFAMAWAKDLKVAEIAKRKTGAKVTDEDLADMARWADVINNSMCERLTF